MSTTYNCVHYDRDRMRPCIYGLAVGDALGVLAAVNLGDDTDTTAAIAGAIAGVYYGFEAIPPKWVGQLRGKTVIDQCI